MDTNLTSLSIAELRVRCQSTSPEAGRETTVGKTVRFFSMYLTKSLLYTPITPLWVTIISVLFFLVGVGIFAFNDMTWNITGLVLIYISIIFDGSNGELARLLGYRSEIGSRYIEPISHDIQYGLMFIPLMINAYQNTGSLLVLFAGLVATIAKLLNRFFIARFDTLRLGNVKDTDTEGEAIIRYNPNVSIIHKMYRFCNRNLFSSVGLIIPLAICAVFNRIDIFLFIFAIAFTAFATAHFAKQITYVARIDKPETVL